MPFSSNDPRDYLALGKQSAQGTEATTFKFLKYLNNSAIQVKKSAQTIYEGGDGQDPGLVYQGNVTADGSADVYARPDTFTYLGAWACGSGVSVPSVAAGGVASHIYVPNSTVPYLTIEQAHSGGNQADRCVDSLISGFTLSAQNQMPWKITVPFVGGGTIYGRDANASGLSATLESGDPAMYAGHAVVIDGATSIDVTQWSFTFARKMDDSLFTVNPFRRTVVPLTRDADIAFQMIVQDRGLWEKVQYGASGGTVVPFNLATGSFHAERALTASQLIAIDVPVFRYNDIALNQLNPDGQTLIYDVKGQAVKAGTSLFQLRANVTSSATSYLV